MRIAFVASEAVPFAKVGGLADVVGSLPKALKKAGHEPVVFLPWYWGIQALYVGEQKFLFEGKMEKFGIGHAEHDGVRYVLIGLGDFAREKPYGYGDDFRRFLRFQLATSVLLDDFDIVHAHDWQAGLLPLLQFLGWFKAPTVFTIHNLAYQGIWNSKDFFAWTGLPGETYFPTLEHNGQVNLMKCGIQSAWAVTTVSPSYAEEILTPKFGEGLDPVLVGRKEFLTGILNGLDTEYWNPETDPHLSLHYSASNMANKAKIRNRLLKEFLLEDRPTMGVVSRFAGQKGIDVIADASPQLLAEGVNILLLGSGEVELEAQFKLLAEKNPGRIAYATGYNEPLAHRIYAGCDGFLMPSRFEPCGLAQLISMRYGTPPVVSAVGGLRDTVKHWRTGFVFDNVEPAGLIHGVREFLKHPNIQSVRLEGMKQNPSWDAPAKLYLGLYKGLLDKF